MKVFWQRHQDDNNMLRRRRAALFFIHWLMSQVHTEEEENLSAEITCEPPIDDNPKTKLLKSIF